MPNSLPPLADSLDTVTKTGLDRRQLLKAGAWAAPAIVLATAAPAAAAGSTPPTGKLTMYTHTASWVWNGSSKTEITGNVTVTAPYQTPTATLGPITLVIQVSGSSLNDATPTISGSNWTFSSTSVSGTTASFTFVYGQSITSGGSADTTSQLTYTLSVTTAATPTTVTFTASAQNAQPASAVETLN